MLLTFLLGFQSPVQVPFAKDIAAFKQADQKSKPALGQVLFIGSSTFTRWTDASDYFPGKPILNRAFGGSTLLDVIRYVDDVVTPYKPSQIVVYCGENDIAGDAKLPAYKVADRFKTLYQLIRKREPKANLVYVSIKPGPARWKFRSKMIAANRWIEEYLATQPNTSFVNIWPVLTNADGSIKGEIFVKDGIHLNASGYQLIAPLIAEKLR